MILGVFFLPLVLGVSAFDNGHFFCRWYLGVFNWSSLFETGVDWCALISHLDCAFLSISPCFPSTGCISIQHSDWLWNGLKEDSVFCPHQGFFCVTVFTFRWVRLYFFVPTLIGIMYIHYYLGIWLLDVQSIISWAFDYWAFIPFLGVYFAYDLLRVSPHFSWLSALFPNLWSAFWPGDPSE